MKSHNSKIEQFFKENQVSAFGIASLSAEVKENLVPTLSPALKPVLQKFDYAISFGFSISKAILQTIKDRPNSLYAAHYGRINQYLDTIGIKLSGYIDQFDFLALPVPASSLTDFRNMVADISHRHIAYYAGLGWFGRNNLLVNPRFGSSLRLATVLTNMPLVTGAPLANGCGTCQACVSVCPAKAIDDAAKVFRKEQCIKQVSEFARINGVKHLICGLCIQVCLGKDSE